MSDLAVQHAAFRYPGGGPDGLQAQVLDDVSVAVDSGRRLALLGPSGSGKSTLLRAVAGLVRLDGGQVLLDGRDITGLATHRRGIGLMFQQHALFPHLDVAGNVAFGLRMAGMAKPQREERVRDMLDLVGLADRAGSPIPELSGGEQQRVALARTLAPAPAVVLLDEPLASLDRVLRESLLATMTEAFEATGATAVFVTHDQAEAMQVGHTVAVMHAGRVLRTGSPREVWDDPRDGWVARFLGLQNVFSRDSGGPFGELAGSGQAVLIRPELIHMVEPDDAAAQFVGHVRTAAFRGAHTVVNVDTAGAELVAWVTGVPPVPGQQVGLDLSAAVRRL